MCNPRPCNLPLCPFPPLPPSNRAACTAQYWFMILLDKFFFDWKLVKIFLEFFDKKKANIPTQLGNAARIYCMTLAPICSMSHLGKS